MTTRTTVSLAVFNVWHCMLAFVLQHVALLCKRLRTDVSHERLHAFMHPCVVKKIPCFAKYFVAAFVSALEVCLASSCFVCVDDLVHVATQRVMWLLFVFRLFSYKVVWLVDRWIMFDWNPRQFDVFTLICRYFSWVTC